MYLYYNLEQTIFVYIELSLIYNEIFYFLQLNILFQIDCYFKVPSHIFTTVNFLHSFFWKEFEI